MMSISAEELQAILKLLNQAVHAHNQWLSDINRTVVCGMPFDCHDVREDAHLECRFGQWYHGNPPKALLEHPAFVAIGVEHKRMHTSAAELLLSSSTDGPVDSRVYDTLINAADGLHLEIAALKKELEDSLYNRDALTGLGNRVAMLLELRRTHELVKRGVQQCSVAMMDVDHFKAVNDRHGHAAGDAVLVALARYVTGALRPYDSMFRFGGEEFVLILPTSDLNIAGSAIERIREGIPLLAVETESGERASVTASFGVAPMRPEVTVEDTVCQADTALYEAKARGRNQMSVAGEPGVPVPPDRGTYGGL